MPWSEQRIVAAMALCGAVGRLGIRGGSCGMGALPGGSRQQTLKCRYGPTSGVCPKPMKTSLSFHRQRGSRAMGVSSA